PRVSPYAYLGVHCARPYLVPGGPGGRFSLRGLWRWAAAAGRLYGCVLDGDWMHVGDPQARDEAEARLAGTG
ncbi:MAG: nucleotidyltransferase family protein, partial [Brevundimonas sp.]|nr:nucleotidyltransferase family protein [Brevundimonas sp.]